MVKYGLLLVSVFISGAVMASDDPTAPLGFVASKTSQKVRQEPLPNLQSIVCQQECYAIISNQVVMPGEKIRGYQVSRVTDSKVTLVRGNQQWELEVFSNNIKK